MNFLAHLALSGIDDEEMMIGNFVADCVKGDHVLDFTTGMQRGIRLHRAIDSFMDTHEVSHKTKSRFVPAAGHYASVITDIVYDYCLARQWDLFYNNGGLAMFSMRCYMKIAKNWKTIPVGMKGFARSFMVSRRLTKYRTIEGIRDTLEIMSRETSLPNIAEEVCDIIASDEKGIDNEFMDFYPQIILFCDAEKERLYATIGK